MDSHAEHYKHHNPKPALEMNSVVELKLNLVAQDLFHDSGVPEDEEENPGAYVHFNLDNDNKSGIDDDGDGLYDEDPVGDREGDGNNDDDKDGKVDEDPPEQGGPKRTGADYLARYNKVTNEDELKRLKIFFKPGVPKEGKVILRIRHIRGTCKAWVWKSATKGAGNEVLVGTASVMEKEWDLSDSEQRSQFIAVMQNLWIEGRSYNGVSWLEVEFKDKKGNTIAFDKVKYTFIAADCGYQPMVNPCLLPCYDWRGEFIGYLKESNQRARLKRLFPNLEDCEFSITDNRITREYNCIAWSIGDRWNWYNPVSSDPNRGIIGIDEEYGDGDGVFELSDLDAFYWRKMGWQPIATGPRDAKAIYYSGYHAAKRKNCSCGAGKWIMYESKCGGFERIEHVWNQLNGSGYGNPVRYYK